MADRLLADGIVLVHLAFIVFVVAGGWLVNRWQRLAWVHIPAALWGAVVEFTGWICPLTPWEQALRQSAGQAGYTGGFIEHYLLPIIYPDQLTSGMQMALGAFVLLVNALFYRLAWRKWAQRH